MRNFKNVYCLIASNKETSTLRFTWTQDPHTPGAIIVSPKPNPRIERTNERQGLDPIGATQFQSFLYFQILRIERLSDMASRRRSTFSVIFILWCGLLILVMSRTEASNSRPEHNSTDTFDRTTRDRRRYCGKVLTDTLALVCNSYPSPWRKKSGELASFIEWGV